MATGNWGGGTLTITDVDSAASFTAQTNTSGSNGYGKFSLASNGAWTYTMDTPHDEFVAGQTYTDSFTAVSADGTTQVITVTLTGTNDAAVIAGVSTASLTESNAVQTATGTLTISDVDSAQSFQTESNITGSNGYGVFSLSSAGVWSYTMNSAQNQFVAGQTYTDSYTAKAADGTTKTVTVTMTGTNDAAVIAGTSTASLTETNAVQSTSGTLTITTTNDFTGPVLIGGGVYSEYGNIEALARGDIVIGANAEAISTAEDREKFKQAMIEIGLAVPASATAHTMDEARAAREVLGIGFEELGSAIAKAWNFPSAIIDAMQAPGYDLPLTEVVFESGYHRGGGGRRTGGAPRRPPQPHRQHRRRRRVAHLAEQSRVVFREIQIRLLEG